jgi:hypothetical protein
MDEADINAAAPAVQLARISRELVADRDEASTERRIATLAVEAVDAVEHAGVSTRDGSGLRIAAASSGLGETCEELQHRRHEGPCIQAVGAAEMCHVTDTMLDPRWPMWGHRVAEMGVRSVLALPLSAATRNLGSLGLYASTPEAFGPSATALAFAYATHAAVALLFARQSAGFDRAVEARHVIGIAQGILATRYGVSVDVSFSLLRRYSNGSNTKLTEVARRVLEEGELPGLQAPEQRLPPRNGRRRPGPRRPSRAGSPSD